MYVLLNLSHYVKSYGHLCQILAFFTMPALQIWPCHVTQEANFEKKIFCNSAFNIEKSCKISSRKSVYFRSYQPKTSLGVENNPPPPLLLGLTPIFSSPILEENAVSVRNDTCTTISSQLLNVRQPLLNCSMKTSKSIN